MFNSLFESEITVYGFVLCIVIALLIGLFISFLQTLQDNYSKSFVCTLALIPVSVAMVIMMVNGNIGAGVAVAGTFSLVRFRSQPGTAKEIGAIFIGMASGITLGIGYVFYAIIFVLIVCVFELVINKSKYGVKESKKKILRITIPEDLNYEEMFNDIFSKYTNMYKIINVKTTNMGSMYKISYELNFKENISNKQFIDELRCMNGNLEISISDFVTTSEL